MLDAYCDSKIPGTLLKGNYSYGGMKFLDPTQGDMFRDTPGAESLRNKNIFNSVALISFEAF